MHLSYTGIVARKNQQDVGVGYALEQCDFKAVSNYPDQRDDVAILSAAACSVYVDTSCPLKTLKIRDESEEILNLYPDFLSTGGYFVYCPNALVTSVYVTIFLGAEDSGLPYLEKSLESQHLAIQFDLDFGLSLAEGNRSMKRPVTFSDFRVGTRFISHLLPRFSLVRRHVP